MNSLNEKRKKLRESNFSVTWKVKEIYIIYSGFFFLLSFSYCEVKVSFSLSRTRSKTYWCSQRRYVSLCIFNVFVTMKNLRIIYAVSKSYILSKWEHVPQTCKMY